MSEKNIGDNLNFSIVQALASAAATKGMTPEQRQQFENNKITAEARNDVASRTSTSHSNLGWYRKP